MNTPTKVHSNFQNQPGIEKFFPVDDSDTTYLRPEGTDKSGSKTSFNTNKELCRRFELLTFENQNFNVSDIFHLRDISARINVDRKSLTYCGKSFVNLGLKDDHLVKITKSGKSNHYQGLFRCGLNWVCPVCAFRLSMKRRDEIANYLKFQASQGKKMYLATLTIRHKNSQTLEEVFDKVKSNWRKLGKARRHRELFLNNDYILSNEVLFGNYGWHPHMHIIWISNNETDFRRQIETFINDWIVINGSEQAAQDLQPIDGENSPEKIARYVTKWDISDELTRMTSKKGKGVSFIEMLKNPEKYRKQILEYSRFTKGKQSFHKSKNVKLKTDQELINEVDKIDSLLLYLEREVFKNVIVKKRIYREILDTADDCEKVLSLLNNEKCSLQTYNNKPLIVFERTTTFEKIDPSEIITLRKGKKSNTPPAGDPPAGDPPAPPLAPAPAPPSAPDHLAPAPPSAPAPAPPSAPAHHRKIIFSLPG